MRQKLQKMSINIRIQRKRSLYDCIVEIIALLCLTGCFYPLFFYGNISNETLIPIHFNRLGEIDGWGKRNFFIITALIALVLYFGLSIYETRLYYKSVKAADNNDASLFKLKLHQGMHIKIFVMLIFAYANNSTYAIVIGKASGINIYFVYGLLACMLIVGGFYHLKMLSFEK